VSAKEPPSAAQGQAAGAGGQEQEDTDPERWLASLAASQRAPPLLLAVCQARVAEG
jgi:hypothetical protein